MRRLLAFNLTACTLACHAALAIDTQKVSNLQLANTSRPLESYFQFANPPAGVAFKITSGGNNVTGYMSGSNAYYYLLMNQGTYNITLNDTQNSTVCSFAINATNVAPTADNPSGHALLMRVISSGGGYRCTLGQIQNWPNLLTIKQMV